ncbi:hypothetical protein [Paracoccus cavernae]|uniref:hypothetical protein n=1 Tax=Paracoccus cavernae TaxID=1571207 RepID=UPI003609250C
MTEEKASFPPIGAALLRLLAIMLLLVIPLSQDRSVEGISAGADLKVLHGTLSDLQRPDPVLITPPLPVEGLRIAPDTTTARRMALVPVPRLGVMLWREASHHARAPPLQL